MRGQHGRQLGPAMLGRIIPARAGPTVHHHTPFYKRTDHPRSCGANKPLPPRKTSRRGSSPLVRGQPVIQRINVDFPRIIPARAGPTHLYGPIIGAIPDHPRSCGANIMRPSLSILFCGSSPLVRGQRRADVCPFRELRIIPARAGPTMIAYSTSGLVADHPRSCGANMIANFKDGGHYGSSPLVRGQQSDFTRKKRVESNKNI